MRIILLIPFIIFSSILASAQDSFTAVQKKLTARDFSGAKADLTKILTADPKNKIALNLRGEARAGLEDFYGAISDYTYALELDSTYVPALNNRGQAKVSSAADETFAESQGGLTDHCLNNRTFAE